MQKILFLLTKILIIALSYAKPYIVSARHDNQKSPHIYQSVARRH